LITIYTKNFIPSFGIVHVKPQKDPPNSNCLIHNNNSNPKISIKSNQNVRIKYSGFEFLWKNVDALWPPSIDSFYMVENIIKHRDLISNPNHQIKSILDIGTGTGFLGIVLGGLIESINELTVTDWTTTSYLFATLNWYHNMRRFPKDRQLSFNYLLGPNTHWDQLYNIKKDTSNYDLVVCNPPYLPIPEEFRELRTEQTTAGTELLENIIASSSQLGKKVIIQFSHLAKDYAEKAAKDNQVILEPTGKPKLVPFRVPAEFKNTKYMAWLLNPNANNKASQWSLFNRSDLDIHNGKYEFYHQIQTFLIRN